MAEPPAELVEELYGAPPGDFIARRDAAARELRSSGDRATADAVKKLRRPSVSAAAVNRLARDAPEEVSALLASGEALRQAQLGGGGDRDSIRSAAADEREAVERLVSEAAAYGLSGAALEEVRSTLHAAALDEDVREDVRRGVLVESRQAMGFGGFGVAVAGPSRPPSRSTKPSSRDESIKGGSARRRSAPDRSAAEAEAERAAAAEAEQAAAAEAERAAAAERKQRVKAARAAVREAERDVKAAESERDRAAKTLTKAESAVDAAAAELERRRAELESAEVG
jgi:hypothetical protein